MTLKVNVRVWRPTHMVPITQDGQSFDHDLFYHGIGDVDGGDDTVNVYIDLDPNPDDPSVSFCSLDLRGTLDDFRTLIEDLTTMVEINAEESQASETYEDDGHIVIRATGNCVNDCPSCTAGRRVKAY